MQYEDHQRWLPYHVPTRACQEGRRTSVISFRTSNPTRIHQEVAQNKLHILCGIFNKKCLSASSQCRYSNIMFIFNSFVSLVFYQSYESYMSTYAKHLLPKFHCEQQNLPACQSTSQVGSLLGQWALRRSRDFSECTKKPRSQRSTAMLDVPLACMKVREKYNQHCLTVCLELSFLCKCFVWSLWGVSHMFFSITFWWVLVVFVCVFFGSGLQHVDHRI